VIIPVPLDSWAKNGKYVTPKVHWIKYLEDESEGEKDRFESSLYIAIFSQPVDTLHQSNCAYDQERLQDVCKRNKGRPFRPPPHPPGQADRSQDARSRSRSSPLPGCQAYFRRNKTFDRGGSINGFTLGCRGHSGHQQGWGFRR